MTNKLFIAGILATSLAVTAIAVQADEGKPGKGPHMRFSELDADGSGEVTREELAARATARFAERDTDGNGVLSREEMIAAAQARAEKRVDRMLRHFDANGDGGLSVDEMPNPMNQMFDRADADNSGGLSEDELADLHPRGMKRKHKN